MADESDFNAVVADVQLKAQTGLDPTLTAGEVQTIVRATAGTQTWVAETALTYGAYVIPTPASLNGRRYRVVVAGTTGETEPSWSLIGGVRFTDGTVTFQEAGPFTGSVYDKRKAIHECLAIRLAKDELVDADSDGRDLKLSQRGQRIRSLMMSYSPLEVA